MNSRYEQRKEALRCLAFGSAPNWDPRGQKSIREYYRRLLPRWPVERKYLTPADRELVEAVLGSLGTAERERIERDVGEIAAYVRDRGDRIESTTRQLIPLILAWSLEADQGKLGADEDPATPLLDLLQAGFQIKYTDAGIEIHYETGWATDRLLSRSEVAELQG